MFKASKNTCFKEHGYVCEQEYCRSIFKQSHRKGLTLLRLAPPSRSGTSLPTTKWSDGKPLWAYGILKL